MFLNYANKANTYFIESISCKIDYQAEALHKFKRIKMGVLKHQYPSITFLMIGVICASMVVVMDARSTEGI